MTTHLEPSAASILRPRARSASLLDSRTMCSTRGDAKPRSRLHTMMRESRVARAATITILAVTADVAAAK